METKETPANERAQWMKDMEKWQKEGEDTRSVLCVTMDASDQSSIQVLSGPGIQLLGAIIISFKHCPDMKDVMKNAIRISENPMIRSILFSILKTKMEPASGNPASEEKVSEEVESKTRSSLKDLFTKLADKF